MRRNWQTGLAARFTSIPARSYTSRSKTAVSAPSQYSRIVSVRVFFL